MVNICIFGAGRMASDHAYNVSTSAAKLYCVVDPKEETGRKMALQYACKYYSNPEEALADSNVDAVMIISSTETHADLIIQSAHAGKPIFCEKPIDLDLQRMDECLNVIEKTNVPFLLGFNRRFDPNFRMLHDNLRKGDLGKLEMLSIISRDNPLPSLDYIKTSGGLFKDMTIHDFDMARWLLGDDSYEVFATASCLIDPEIGNIGDVDSSLITLKTSKGVLCQISNSRRSVYGYDQRIEVFGEKGMIRAENSLPTTLEYFGEKGIKKDTPYPSFPQRYQLAYKEELRHFIEDVIKGKKPYVSGEDGRGAFVLAEAAQESLKTRSVVNVSQYKSFRKFACN